MYLTAQSSNKRSDYQGVLGNRMAIAMTSL